MKFLKKKKFLKETTYQKILGRHLRRAVKRIESAVHNSRYSKDLEIIPPILSKRYDKSGRREFCLTVKTGEGFFLIALRPKGYQEIKLPIVKNGETVSDGKVIPWYEVKKNDFLSFLLKQAREDSRYFFESDKKFYHIVQGIEKTSSRIVVFTKLGEITSYHVPAYA